MKDPLLTIKEAAAQKNLSRAAIYAAIAGGKLPRRYSKGNLVVRQSDLIVWEGKEGKRGPRKGSKLSEEHKASIAEAQALRWKRSRREKSLPDETG